MLKSKVGYSISTNDYTAGQEATIKASVDMPDA